MTGAISHPVVAKRLWDSLGTKRTNIVGRGDSNQVYGGFGWDEGFQRALTAIGNFPMWGSGVQTRTQWDDVNQVYASTEMGYQIAATGGQFLAATGAPAALAKFFAWPLPAVVTHRYSYLAAGTPTAPWGQAVQMLVANAAIGPASRLRYHQQVGVFPSGTGTYRNVVRLEDAGQAFAEIARDPALRTLAAAGATHETREDFFDVQALAGRTTALGWRLTTFAQQEIAAAAWFGWFSVENRDRPSGYRWSNLITGAGQSLYEFVLGLRDTESIVVRDAVIDFLRRVADQPNQQFPDDGTTPIGNFVCSGANDINRAQLSLGPNPAPTRSAEGYFDNLVAMDADDEALYSAAGIDPDRRVYIIVPVHPSFDADESTRAQYREAAAEFCSQTGRGFVIDWGKITTPAEMLQNNWFNLNGTDKNHLAQAGYQNLAERAVTEWKNAVLAVPVGGGDTPTHTGYLSPFEADDLIVKAGLTGNVRASWDNASTATREAAIYLATRDIDAVRWDGVRKDEEQPFQWPRRESVNSAKLKGRDAYRTGFEQVLDLPHEVRLACAIQAAVRCGRMNGLDPGRVIEQATARGVISQSGGGQSESYDLKAATSTWASLCVDAQRLLSGFRLSGGSFV